MLNGENSITHTDDTANENNGIKTEDALTIDGAGFVTAYGASGKQYARGMYVNGVLIVNGGAVTATGEVYPFEYQGETMDGIASAIVSSDEAVTVNIPVTYEVKGSTSSGTEQDTVISSLGETSADISGEYRYVEIKAAEFQDAEFTVEYTPDGAKITNTSSYPVLAAVIIAYYDTNNALSEITVDEKTTFTAKEVYNITADKTKGDYKVFVWNSLAGMKPLSI